MAGKCIDSEYFSGQGALMLGERDPITGDIVGGLRPVGNVSNLVISTATQTLDHRESCSGQRALDLQITRQIDVTVAITMESISRENLALALNGTSSVVAGASVTGEAIKGYVGAWTPLEHINVSDVVVTSAGTPVTGEENIEVDEGAGAICIPVGSTVADGADLEVAYTFEAYDDVEALSVSGRPIRFARFAGLNTASESVDAPVVVDLYKLQVAPLAEFALINDELASFVLNSACLADSKRAKDKSQFFRVRKLAA